MSPPAAPHATHARLPRPLALQCQAILPSLALLSCVALHGLAQQGVPQRGAILGAVYGPDWPLSLFVSFAVLWSCYSRAYIDTMYNAELEFTDQLLGDWSVRTENPWEGEPLGGGAQGRAVVGWTRCPACAP